MIIDIPERDTFSTIVGLKLSHYMYSLEKILERLYRSFKLVCQVISKL